MLRNAFLISFLIYLISCTSSDNANRANELIGKPVKTSLGSGKSKAAKIAEFSTFLQKLSKDQMIPASETDLHNTVKNYLPDSTISEGFDLHIREIGRIDTFRLVFHEYFDLYDDWSKTYLDIFSPVGNIQQSIRMWDLSFEGSTNLNFINNEIVEIAYHDFFDQKDMLKHAIIPDQLFYIHKSTKVSNRVEGTVYEYYKISEQGKLRRLSQKTQISIGRQFPQATAKLLSSSELESFEEQEIKLMKNEILAQNGYIFSDHSIQEYFEKQDWYAPRLEYKDSLLTDVEQLNFALLSKIQQEY